MAVLHITNAISSGQGRRYWLTASLAAVGVAVAILVLVVLPVLLLTSQLTGQGRHLPTVLLDDILEQKYSPRWFNGSWISDNEFIFKDESGRLLLHNIETLSSVFLVSNESMIPNAQCSYSLSADRKFILVGFNFTKRFRHLLGSLFYIIDLEAQTVDSLNNTQGLPDPGFIQAVSWTPQGNGLAYVYRNNLYYRRSAADVTDYQVTSSGIRGVVYNGATDWIYNDAVYSSHQALWFSENGTRLAYVSFNDTNVRTETISWYGEPNSPVNQYTTPVYVKYPKPGTPNPNVTLNVVDIDDVILKKNESTKFSIQIPNNLSEPILMAVTWANDEELVSVWTNRVGSTGALVVCNCVTFKCKEVWRTVEATGWVGIFSPPRVSLNGSRLLLILPHEQRGDVGAFRHLTVIDTLTEKTVALTEGQLTVTDILAWDEAANLIYFGGVFAENPARAHLFTVSDDASEAPYSPKCLTCGWRSAHSGKECHYNTAYFSKNASYYMHFCMGPDVPEIGFYDKSHNLVSVWDTNDHVTAMLAGKARPRTLRLQVALPEGFTANVQLWLPNRVEPGVKYPLLVDVYAGPDSIQISDRFELDWRVYLATNLSVVYAVIDGRGTSLRGDRLMFATHRRLGTVEIQDQILVTQHLLSEFTFLDPSRVAIWGWSYGGYSTLKVLENDTAGVFRCGIAVAPVTDWIYYTSFYTERMMGLPTEEDNWLGYQEANANINLDNLRNKKLLLVHGTFDNIALFHNSMIFARALEQQKIMFQQQSYTDEDHGLVGVTHHFYYTMVQFLQQCFHMET